MKLALIGAGRWGTNIQKTLDAIGGVELGVSHTDAQTKELLEEDLVGALIATPGSTHADIALPFIERGIPTFIEKPFTTSLKDALKLEKAALKSGAPVMIGHIHLYNPAYIKAKSLIEKAAYAQGSGEPKAGGIRSLTFEGMNNGPFRDDMSALWDWTPHDVSMAIDIMGEMPKSVQAWGQKILRPKTNLYDTVTVKLTFSSSLRSRQQVGEAISATIHNSWLAPEKRKKMVVVGKNDSIIYDDVKPEQKVTHYRGMGPRVQGKSVTWQDPAVSHPKYGAMSPLEAEMRAFLKMVKSDKNPSTDLKSAIDVTRVLDAAERSMEVDQEVEIS